MPPLQLTSYDAFVDPLNYHREASLFLQHVGTNLPQRATAVLRQLQRHHPRFASQLSGMITELGQRLTDEGQGHDGAVTYLQSHRQFLAQNEALLSGTPVAEFPPLTDVIPDWLQVTHSPLAGCFEAFTQFINTYEHDLYSADQKLRAFEDVVWRALHRPDSLRVHVDWSGNPLADGAADIVNFGADHLVNDPVELALTFVRDHEGGIRDLVDSMRKGLETIFLPLVDGEILQKLIDEVAALRQAYQHHVSEPFVPSTHRLAANYRPPQGQASYHDSLASTSQQQALTLEALTTLLTQLQAVQTFNEQLVGSQLAIGGFLLLGLVAVGAVIVFFPDAPAALVGMLGSVGGTLAELAGVATIWELIGGAFAAIEAATGLPALAWVLVGIAITAAVATHTDTSTAVTTQHQVSITLVGGGASNGGQTVVVNGTGTGDDAQGWASDIQQDWAWEAARACAKARADHLKKTKGTDGDINYAEGFLSLNGAFPPESYGPILGRGGQPTHSEQVIVNYWSQQRIPQLRPVMKPGSHLVLMIFTRNPMCPGCSGMVPVWNQELAAAAGPGVTIHFYIWQSIDPYLPVEPGNIIPVPGL